MDGLCLRERDGARDRCVSLKSFRPGDLLLSVPSFTTIVLPDQKGHRCDGCFTASTNLQRCSGCASYWYCGSVCQSADWKLQHKKLCKHYNQYTASLAYQALAKHEKMDATMLSHLAAQLSMNPDATAQSDLYKTAMDLLPASTLPTKTPPIAFNIAASILATLKDLFARFGNNNFAIHSHFSTVGHGVFPLASRLFNHSCLPNAVATYKFVAGMPVQMRVSALRNIAPDEEVCLTYLDPALLQSRRKIFEITYGFTCTCSSCLSLNAVGTIPEPSSDALPGLSEQLSDFAQHNSEIRALPSELRPVLHESFLARLSDQFSATSHDGPYEEALQTGKFILALYTLIYPPNYPQTGLHLLEMAKTAWNLVVVTDNDSKKAQVIEYLCQVKAIWDIIGQEGDDDGPLKELEVLTDLVRT